MKYPWVGATLSAVMVALTAWLSMTGVLHRPFGLVAYGANVPLWLRHGQLDRLATSNLLHVSWTHLASNVAMLILPSLWLERERMRFLATLLASGLVAASVSALVLLARPTAAFVCGGSALVFAALGAWCVRIRRGDRLQTVAFALLVVHCALSLWGEGVSVSMHLSGLVAGALCMRWLPTRTAPALVAIYGASVSVSLARADPALEIAAMHDYAEVASAPATLLPVAEFWVAEARATGQPGPALVYLRALVGSRLYEEPEARAALRLRFGEALLLAWRSGLRLDPVTARETCGVIVEANDAVAAFCGPPRDAQHVSVWVGEEATAERYKRWPLR